MIRVAITDAQPGDTLARSVLNPARPEQALLKRGVKLNGRIIAALKRFGIRSLWLQGDGMGYLEELIREERFDAGRRALGELKNTLSRMSADVKYEGGFAAYRDRVIDIFHGIRDNKPVYCMLDDIRANEGDVLFHGGNVCYLAMLMGLTLESYIFEERRKSAGSELAGQMAPLGLGALLHDVGKLLLPEGLRARRPWELTVEERDVMRGHVVKGFTLLRPQVGAITANMALCHHKNMDNTGYPEDLAESGSHLPGGAQIHVFSRVVAVANAYDE
ncbi:MAG: HD-GYP domain-containing protein, partial [Planctomycetota bacterium]